MDIGELDKLYTEADQVDGAIFSEMRSNVLLIAGEHYNKKGSKIWDRLRNNRGVAEAQKLRLTKNHVATLVRKKVVKTLSSSPTTTVIPNNESELQDQKAAELNKAVWEYYKKKHKLSKKFRRLAQDFVGLGESYTKIFWDDSKGETIGYAPLKDEEGNPVIDEMGRPVPDKNSPVQSGDMCFERILPFNLLRSPTSQSLEESPYLIVRKMVEKSVVRRMVGDDQEKLDAISNMDEESFLVFDGDRGSFSSENKKVMLREYYFRPCVEYPKGYYYITVKGTKLLEGELPFGIWNIAACGWDEIATSARYRSSVKQMRPYQIEINRTASKIAETQITSDDTLILQNGSKMTPGGTSAGLKSVSITGAPPTVIPGRSGEQYVGYMEGQIAEMYRVCEEEEDGAEGPQDMYAALFRSAKNKQKFSHYAEEFGSYLEDITEITLELAKQYLDEEAIVPMIGKSEIVNIPEFKTTEKLKYSISIEQISEDAETMMGRQLAINHTLQYVGKDLDKSQIGQMLRVMPFMNKEEAFKDLTIDYDMSKNDMLALERGESPMVNKHDNHTYLIQRAVTRMKSSDFKLLDPRVQQAYQVYISQHSEQAAQTQLEIQRANEGLIPVTGAMITVDYYSTYTDEKGEPQTKRVKMPMDALNWLEEHLSAQNTSLQKLEELDEGTKAQVGQQIRHAQHQQAQQAQQMQQMQQMPPNQ